MFLKTSVDYQVNTGISLALKMIPEEVLDEYREKVQSELNGSKPKNWVAAIIIVLIWLLVVYLFLRFVYGLFLKVKAV